MKKEDVEKYLDTKIKVVLKGSGHMYHGVVRELQDDSFVIYDKFKNDVTIAYSEIAVITPTRGGRE